jgi:hypothetical protein
MPRKKPAMVASGHARKRELTGPARWLAMGALGTPGPHTRAVAKLLKDVEQGKVKPAEASLRLPAILAENHETEAMDSSKRSRAIKTK